MKKLPAVLVISAFLFSCSSNDAGKGKFTLNGELKGLGKQRVFLEEVFFSDKAPEVLDSGLEKSGKFSVAAIAKEEGVYRLRVENSDRSYLFINDENSINFTGDINNSTLSSYSFSGAANSSLKKALLYADSMGNLLSSKGQLLNTLAKSGASPSDSIVMSLSSEYKTLTDNFSNYCLAFADTAKSPMLSLFVITMAPIELKKFQEPLAKLVKRFPKHKGIESTATFIKARIVEQTAPQPAPPTTQAIPEVGSMAPDITMNDVNDKPFSLSSLKGKFVLLDFWASWCGPCRDENPNIVAAYNQYKDKNFTILGVSLDEKKTAWIEAIKEDNLNWHQVSDLKYWNSAAVPLYGIELIPHNVLIDPTGKIIAINLRGSALLNKLAEVLK